jgi:hydrogenase maturation protein HypF
MPCISQQARYYRGRFSPFIVLTHDSSFAAVRHRWQISGQVQGVGFRPFVYRLAQRHYLTGFVRNEVGRVVIEAQGSAAGLEQFGRDLEAQRPPLAVVGEMSRTALPPCEQEGEFRIVASVERRGLQPEVTVDTAVCADCHRELLDASDRRFGYGLINCTNCGPRYSIVRRVPYDRPNTTMGGFAMCGVCRAEYIDPADRRFHAQPIACHDCGPQLSLVDGRGGVIEGDPMDGAVGRLAAGQILAIKGIGGFHLAVRADDVAGVNRLRELKKRDCKPFAVMCASIEVAGRLVELSEAAVAALTSPAAPIVLALRTRMSAADKNVCPTKEEVGRWGDGEVGNGEVGK